MARYDDAYVEELNSHGGSGEGVGGTVTFGGVGGVGKHDNTKMFRSCGKMVAGQLSEDDSAFLPSDANVSNERSIWLTNQRYNVHHLIPQPADGSISLVLDRTREFRLRFHLASIPLGWAWLIPAFHLPEPVPSDSRPATKRIHTLHFPRSQIDFAIGPGAAIHEILVRLEEVSVDEEAGTARVLGVKEEIKLGMEDRRGEGSVREDGD